VCRLGEAEDVSLMTLADDPAEVVAAVRAGDERHRSTAMGI